MKTIPITLKIPAFLLSPWAWGPLVLAAWLPVSLVSNAVMAEAVRHLPGITAESPEYNTQMTFDGIELPCGHPVGSAMVGGFSTSYTCTHGHQFRPFGNYYVPTGR